MKQLDSTPLNTAKHGRSHPSRHGIEQVVTWDEGRGSGFLSGNSFQCRLSYGVCTAPGPRAIAHVKNPKHRSVIPLFGHTNHTGQTVGMASDALAAAMAFIFLGKATRVSNKE